MRIVFVTFRYWPAIGGVERYIGHLAAALVQRGHEVSVLAGAHIEGLPPRESRQGVTILRFPAHRSSARCRLRLLGWRGVLASADVIHCSDVFMLEYLQRMLGRALPDGPLFLTQHGMSFRFPVPEEEKRRAQAAAARVDGLAHDGTFIQRWLGVVPDVVPPQGLFPTAEELPQVPEPDATSAVFVGRIEPDGQLATYLDALRILRADHGLDLRLHVYGEGSRRAELAAAALADGLPVRWHGARQDAADHFLDGCFAFVTGRMAIHEAMARRRLVIAAYDTPLKRDYLCGEAFSAYLLAGARASEIAALVAEQAADRTGRLARTSAAFEYARALSWERTAECYESLWQAAPRRARAAAGACVGSC